MFIISFPVAFLQKNFFAFFLAVLSSDDLELAWETKRTFDFNRDFFLSGFILKNYSLEESVVSYWLTGIII